MPCHSDFGTPCCLHPSVAGSALGATHFRGHIHVHCRYGPVTRDLPKGNLRLPRQACFLLNTPAFHWTHNRMCRFPASSSPTGFTVRHTGRNRPRACFARWISLLRYTTQQSRTASVVRWCSQALRQSPRPRHLRKHQKSGPFPPALPGFNGRTTLSDSRHDRRLLRR
jgi:hypothetical protein